MLRKDLPTRINLTDGTSASVPSTITVYANPIIAQTRINLGGEVATLVPIPVPGYPASQTHRYIPASVSGLTWYNAIGTDTIALTNAVFSNNELVFNGSSSKGSWATPIIPATTDFSISFFVKANSIGAFNCVIEQDSGGAGGRFITGFDNANSTNNIRFALTGQLLFRRPNVILGQYYHVTIVREGDVFSLYVNGSLFDSLSVSGVSINQKNTSLGVYQDSSYFFNGFFKYVGVCVGTAMTVDEIESEYNQMAYL